MNKYFAKAKPTRTRNSATRGRGFQLDGGENSTTNNGRNISAYRAALNRKKNADALATIQSRAVATTLPENDEDDYITLNLLPRQPKKGLTTNIRRQIITAPRRASRAVSQRVNREVQNVLDMVNDQKRKTTGLRRQIVTAPRRASRSAQSAVNAIRGLDRQQIMAALDMADKRVGQAVARVGRKIERFRNAGGFQGMIDRELFNSSPTYNVRYATYRNMLSNRMNRRYARMSSPRVTSIMDRGEGSLSDGVKSQYGRAVRNTGTAYATIAAQPLLSLLNRAFTPSQKEEYSSGGSSGMRKRGTIHKGKNARRWKTLLAGKENGGGGRAMLDVGIGGLPATKEDFYTGGYVHRALASRNHPAHNEVTRQLDTQRRVNATLPEYQATMRNARNANPSSRSSNPVRNLNAKLDELANQLAPINRAKKKQNQMKELRSYQQRQKTLHNTVLAATALKALQEAAKNRFQ